MKAGRAAALLVVLAGSVVACGESTPGDGSALCASSYEPATLVERGPLASPGLGGNGAASKDTSTTDTAAIRKVVAAACALPPLPKDIACTLELGPSFELRFTDARGSTSVLTVATFGCQVVDGLAAQRYQPKPLWDAVAAARLPRAGR